MIYSVRRFSKIDNREDASSEVIEKAKTSGVVQKVDGRWRIVSIKKGKLWSPVYKSKEDGQKALRGFHAQKGFATLTPEDREKYKKSGEMEALKWDKTLPYYRKLYPKKSDDELLIHLGKIREKRNKNSNKTK